MYIYKYVYLNMNIYKYIYIYIYIFIYLYIDVHTYTYIHTYIKIQCSFRETSIFQNDFSCKNTKSGPKTLYFPKKALWKIAVSFKLLENFKNGLRSPE